PRLGRDQLCRLEFCVRARPSHRRETAARPELGHRQRPVQLDDPPVQRLGRRTLRDQLHAAAPGIALRSPALRSPASLIEYHASVSYNAAVELVDRHVAEGRGARIAFRDDAGSYDYAELARRTAHAGHALRSLGTDLEQRVLLCMLDSIDFVATFFGAIKIG